MPFQHHYICRDLPLINGTFGDYGQATLADVDRDGDLDFAGRDEGRRREKAG